MVRRHPVPIWVLPFLLCAFWFCATAATAADSAAPADQPPPAPRDEYYENYKVLIDTIDEVDRNYVKPIDRRELVEAAIRGVLSKLDPYSSYISPKELSSFVAAVENEFGGVGIQISLDDGDLRVLSPLYGTPAYRAGVLAGDWIVEIDGRSTEGLTQDEAIERLKGVEGSRVTLTLVHAGRPAKERFKVTLRRERIHVDTVLGDHRKADDTWDFMLDPKLGIGYVRVAAFGRETARDLRRGLQQLRAQGVRGLVLDLRFNPGGLLNSAIEVSNLFISHGRIVSTEGRSQPARVWNARPTGAFEGFPMVVLVNHYSASASEIVAACLQDHQRAVIMGERTWGKGSVQNVIEMEDGRSRLKLTTAAYHRPSGKNIHRFPDSKDSDTWGVMPDAGFDLRLSDHEEGLLLTDRQTRDVLRPHPAAQQHATGPGSQPPGEHTTMLPLGTPVLAAGVAATAPAAPSAAPAKAPAAPAALPARTKSPASSPRPVHAAAPEKAPFVDRQLQMAVKYLTEQLARAK
jgi:carboxyl-terminal processing protease